MGTVYRIQSNRDRARGVYRGRAYGEPISDIVVQLSQAHSNFSDPGHPEVSEDIGRGIHIEEYSGFNSAAALLRWFRGFIPNLLRAGYEIVVLHNVTITGVGEHQVLFTWEGEGTK
jgi:hypothetical protein